MATTNAFTTVLKFFKSLSLVETIRDKGSEDYENMGISNGVKETFWFDNPGLIESTYTIYYGSANTKTALTETTDYTVDLDTNKVSLTAAGKTVTSANTVYSEYSYNQAGILNSEALRVLNYAENYFLRKTEMGFANYTDTDPSYKKIINEISEGRFDAKWKTFDTFFNPIVDLSTTVSADYVTGATSLVLKDSSGFPNAGTINIDENKVVYTSLTADTITVPSGTVSISADTVVVGEVIEISKESEGTTPDYEVLSRDTDYKIDFLQGRVELLGNAYFGEFQDSDRFYPANYMIRKSYMSAWYEEGSNPEIPDDVEQCVFMVATNRLMKSTVGKAHITGLNKFNPGLVAVDRTDIDEIIEYYKQLNVGTSPFNKSHIS